MNIGNIELPIVSDIETRDEADVTEIKDGFKNIDSTAVKHKPKVETLVISGFLNEEIHSNNISISEQKRKIKELRKKKAIENSINYKDYKGHLLSDSVNFTDNSGSKIINEVEIEARYFPWPKYYSEDEP